MKLLENVHPSNWVNPTPTGKYNVVVIGGGSAGLIAAIGAAGLGAKVALIERHLLGGDCLNAGCLPSKAVIRASRVVAEMPKGLAFIYRERLRGYRETPKNGRSERLQKFISYV